MANIRVTFAASANNASPVWRSTILQAATDLSSQLKSSASCNVTVGYGEIEGQPMDANALGESSPFFGFSTWPLVRAALLAANPTYLLPTSDPATSAPIVFNALQKAMKLTGDNTGTDGFIGLASSPGDWNVDGGGYDLYGTFAHELSEVMGRVIMPVASMFGPYDLFDWQTANVPRLVGSQGGYFSVDGGVTNLKSFNSQNGADYGDWQNGSSADSFDAFGSLGATEPISSVDMTVFNALAWNYGAVVTPPPATGPGCTLTANPMTLTGPGTTTLTWTSQNATSASLLPGIGSVPLNGTKTVPISVTTTFTLTVTDASGLQATSQMTVSDKKPRKPPHVGKLRFVKLRPHHKR